MKKIAILILVCTGFSLTFTACKKKKYGYCYCKYFSGDKTNYDLTSMPRDKQKDSCTRLDALAEGFAGDCKLE